MVFCWGWPSLIWSSILWITPRQNDFVFWQLFAMYWNWNGSAELDVRMQAWYSNSLTVRSKPNVLHQSPEVLINVEKTRYDHIFIFVPVLVRWMHGNVILTRKPMLERPLFSNFSNPSLPIRFYNFFSNKDVKEIWVLPIHTIASYDCSERACMRQQHQESIVWASSSFNHHRVSQSITARLCLHLAV